MECYGRKRVTPKKCRNLPPRNNPFRPHPKTAAKQEKVIFPVSNLHPRKTQTAKFSLPARRFAAQTVSISSLLICWYDPFAKFLNILADVHFFRKNTIIIQSVDIKLFCCINRPKVPSLTLPREVSMRGIGREMTLWVRGDFPHASPRHHPWKGPQRMLYLHTGRPIVRIYEQSDIRNISNKMALKGISGENRWGLCNGERNLKCELNCFRCLLVMLMWGKDSDR